MYSKKPTDLMGMRNVGAGERLRSNNMFPKKLLGILDLAVQIINRRGS